MLLNFTWQSNIVSNINRAGWGCLGYLGMLTHNSRFITRNSLKLLVSAMKYYHSHQHNSSWDNEIYFNQCILVNEGILFNDSLSSFVNQITKLLLLYPMTLYFSYPGYALLKGNGIKLIVMAEDSNSELLNCIYSV